MLRRFIRLNRRASSAIERHLPQRRTDISLLYELTVAECMRTLPCGAIVVDAGAGPRCSFYEYKPAGLTIVGVDASENDLRANREIDSYRVADITRRLPFDDCTVDIVASKHVLEHLPDVGRFVAETRRVLKPGGTTIHLLPLRYAPFALLSRLAPDRVKLRLLHRLHPETEGSHRFHTHYDRCAPSALVSLLRRNGFVVESAPVSYYQSHYFGFFVPLYVASATYELVLFGLKAKELAASLLVVARKTPGR